MAIDFDAVLFGPVYGVLAVGIALTLSDTSEMELRGIDKTSGVEVGQAGVDVQTVRPAAIVRGADLVAAGVEPDELLEATAIINGASWRVVSHILRQSPNGQADGEVYLLLQAAS